MDIISHIPSVIENTEILTRKAAFDPSLTGRKELLKQSWDLHSQLDHWYTNLLAKSKDIMYTQGHVSSILKGSSSTLQSQFPTSLHFKNFEIARLHLFYWASLLLLYDNIDLITSSHYSSVNNPSLTLGIAALIATSMEYLLSEEMQILGPQNVFFPLRIAMHAFSKVERDGKNVRWCRDVFEVMDERGFPFGKILASWEWEDIPVRLAEGE